MTEQTSKPKLRVAVIGTGIGGLSAAWLLSNQTKKAVDVCLYEKHSSFGLAAHSVTLPPELVSTPSPYHSSNSNEKTKHDTQFYVDVPLRVFSEKYYPTLASLYGHLGVAITRQDYSFSISSLFKPDSASEYQKETFFLYSNYGLLNWVFIPFLKARYVFSKRIWEIVYHLFRLLGSSQLVMEKLNATYKQAYPSLYTTSGYPFDNVPPINDDLHHQSFGEYLRKNNYSQDFIDAFLVPCFSVICTCNREQILSYPASVLLEYFSLMIVKSPLFRVVGGSREISQSLAQNIKPENCHFNSCVQRVFSKSNGNEKKVYLQFEDGKLEEFDHVIIAGQANHASKILYPPNSDEETLDENDKELRKAFDSFVHTQSSVIVHTDDHLMPNKRTDWGPLNLFRTPDGETMVTVWMNQINPQIKDNVFQTWNPLIRPRESTIIAERYFERPIMSNEQSYIALRTIQEAQGRNHIWFCGAYSLFQVPLLESAALSGLQVAQSITGCDVPWDAAVKDEQKLNLLRRKSSWLGGKREQKLKEFNRSEGALDRLKRLLEGVFGSFAVQLFAFGTFFLLFWLTIILSYFLA